MCQSGTIRYGMSEEAVIWRSQIGGDVQGGSKMADTMPTLWGGYHNGVYGGALEAVAWYVASD